MTKFKALFSRLIREEEGAAASEYAVLVAIIIVAIAAAVKLFNLNAIFGTASNQVVNCMDGNC